MMTEEEVRTELIDQMTENEENDSCDPAETSEDVGGVSVGVIGGIGAGLAVLGAVGVKVYKDIKSGKVKERIDGYKKHCELQKQTRQTIKEIKAEAKGKINAIKHPAVETPADTSEEVAAEAVNTKKASKK